MDITFGLLDVFAFVVFAVLTVAAVVIIVSFGKLSGRRDGDPARDFVCRLTSESGRDSVLLPLAAGNSPALATQFGADAFHFYTRTKTVTLHRSSGLKEGASFVIPTMS